MTVGTKTEIVMQQKSYRTFSIEFTFQLQRLDQARAQHQKILKIDGLQHVKHYKMTTVTTRIPDPKRIMVAAADDDLELKNSLYTAIREMDQFKKEMRKEMDEIKKDLQLSKLLTTDNTKQNLKSELGHDNKMFQASDLNSLSKKDMHVNITATDPGNGKRYSLLFCCHHNFLLSNFLTLYANLTWYRS